jgi:regulator of protease activity HflC (stomatin/prohibitin superfamily)
MHAPLPLLMLLCAVAALVAMSVRRIPEGHAYTLRRVGGQLRTVGAGLHLVMPLVERVAHKIRLLNNVVDVQTAALNGRVYFQVLDAERADAVIDAMADMLRQRIPELAASTCTEDDSAARNLHLKAELNRDFGERGVLITRVQLSGA